MKHLFAEDGHDRTKLMDKAAYLDVTIETVKRIDTEPGFKASPRRRVVERTFGRMIRRR
jgi:putative transposase